MGDFFEQVKMTMRDLKTSDLKAKYIGSAKEQIMNTIFDKIDAFDQFGGFPSNINADTFTSLKKDGIINLDRFEKTYNINYYLYDNGELSPEKVKNFFGDNIDIKDVQQALNDMVAQSKIEFQKGVDKIGQEIEENQQKVKQENPDIPNAVLENLGPDDKVKVVKQNGQTYYHVYEDDEKTYFEYDSQGNLTKRVGYVGIGSTVNGIEHSAKETELFDKEGRSYGEIYEYDNGFIEMRDYKNKRVSKQFGKTKYNYSLDSEYNEHLESITLNEGLPTATKMNIKRGPDGKIQDIEFNADDNNNKKMVGEYKDLTIKQPPVRMTEKEKKDLIDFLNSGAILGDDFELKFNGIKIEINPVIKDKNGKYLDSTPNSFKQEVIDLMKKGLHNGSDYDLSVDDDGNYQIDYQSQKSKGYEGDEKIVKYSRDGKTKTTLTTDGNVVKTETTRNGQTSSNTSNRDEELLAKLLEGKFNDANDLLGDIDYEVNNFDFFAVCDKYQQMTGKNLMQELIKLYKEGKIQNTIIKRLAPTVGWNYYDNHYSKNYLKDPVIQNLAQEEYDRGIKLFKEIQNFNPRTSQVADMLPSIGERENISANKSSQKIGNKTYTVEKNENSITVSCNGQTHTINLNGIHQNIQNMIFDTNPAALFRIAEKGIKLETLDDTQATQNGGYAANSIVMNAGRTSASYFKRALVHETGHSFYNKEEFPVNPQFEASFKEEKAAWEKAEDEFKEGNHAYAAEDPTEFFAEAYCLLVTGESKSAYTICKYFPKTLAIVKQMLGD